VCDDVASSFQLSNSVYLKRCRTGRVDSLFNRSMLKYVHNLKYFSKYHSKIFNLYLCEPYFSLLTILNLLTILLNQDFDDVMLSLLDRAKYTEEWLTETP
jgi:hypothetical protein